MKYCNSNSILHSYHVKRRHNLWNCKNVCVAETFEKLLLSVALSDVGVGLMVEPFFVSFFIKWLQLHNPDYIFYLGFVFVIFPLLRSSISWPLAWTDSWQFNFILDTKHLGLASGLLELSFLYGHLVYFQP